MARPGPGDVGRRVSLRHAAPGGGQTDTVGDLLSWSDGELVVRRRDGAQLRLPERAVVAGRVVPDPAREITDVELERIAALGWRGLEESRLGGWLLRAAEGWTGRANSVLPLGDPGVPLDEALDGVLRWYADRGLPGRFQLPLPFAGELDAELADRGWTTGNAALVMTADVVTVRDRTAESAELPPVTVEPAPSAAWLAAYHYRGAALPDVAARVLVNAPAVACASVSDESGVVAIGRGAVAERWLGVTAMEVAPRARRRGLALHVLRALAAWGGRNRARHVYLQVAEGNTAGRALYERAGFGVHHRYHYREAPR